MEENQPLLQQSPNIIARHMLEEPCPASPADAFCSRSVPVLDAGVPDPSVLRDLDELDAMIKQAESGKFERNGQLYGEIKRLSLRTDTASKVLRCKLEGERKDLLNTMDRKIFASCFPHQGLLMLKKPSDMKGLSTRYHAIAFGNDMISWAISAGFAPGMPSSPIICIPPTALDDADVLALYEKKIAPKSECLFDERQHADLPAYDFSPMGRGRGICPTGTQLASLLLTKQACQCISMHAIGSISRRRRDSGASRGELGPGEDFARLALPSDLPCFKELLRQLSYEDDDEELISFVEHGGDFAENIDAASTPGFMQELVARDKVLDPLWKHVLGLDGKKHEDVDDWERAFEHYGIMEYLDALADGVPMEDLLA